MDYKRELKNRIHKINKGLESYLKPEYPETLYESMLYSLMAGGKRLRPLLLLGACEAEGGNWEDAMPFACALEMIHTYSLIHDDLPAMDNDDFRRGKPTNHKIYGDAMAILAGDGLLNKAYEIMSAECGKNINEKKIRAMSILAEAAGTRGMVGGQAADLLQEKNEKGSLEVLEYIHAHKTAALLSASVEAGAVLGGADESKQKQYRLAGSKLGMAFQMKDDILNVIGTPEILGKPVNSDEKKRKLTYVSYHGLDKAEYDFADLSNEISAYFDRLCTSNCFLTELVKTMADRVK